MQIVRRPRRQRGGRMHYMRRRFQKGKGFVGKLVPDDLVAAPAYGLMALVEHLQHSRKKKNIKTKREKTKKKQTSR